MLMSFVVSQTVLVTCARHGGAVYFLHPPCIDGLQFFFSCMKNRVKNEFPTILYRRLLLLLVLNKGNLYQKC
jgi:hypothetical protein